MRYSLVMLFMLLSLLSSSAYAISTDPFGMAGDVSTYTSCIVSSVFRLAFIMIIPAIVLLLLYKFIQIERSRQTGEVYMDEIISLFAIGFAIALVFRLISSSLEYFGVPVEKTLYANLYCDVKFAGEVKCKDLFDTENIKACESLGFGEITRFLLMIAVFLARLFLIFSVVFAIFIGSSKIFSKQMTLFKERRQSAAYSILKGSVDTMVLLIIITLFTYGVYGLIYVDHMALTKWFFKVIANQLGLGGS